MTYVPGGQKDDEEQQAPGVSAPSAPTIAAPSVGSTASVGGTASGNSAAAPKQSNGTGFVNIDRVLSANRGEGARVRAMGEAGLSKDADNFTGKASAFGGAVHDQDVGAIDAAGAENVVNYALTSGDRGVESAKSIVNNKYTGPKDLAYDIGKTAEIEEARKLADPRATGSVLAQKKGGPYGTGLAAIDRAIYGSKNESQDLRALGESTDAQVGAQTQKKSDLETYATEVGNRIAANRDIVSQAFRNRAGGVLAAGQKEADAANAARNAERQKPQQGAYDVDVVDYGPNGDPPAEAFLKPGEGQHSSRQFTADYNKADDATKARFGELRRKFPNMRNSYALSLAQQGYPKSGKKTNTYDKVWNEGGGPATALNFADDNALHTIGSVLNDAGLLGLQKTAYNPGGWVEPTDENGMRVREQDYREPGVGNPPPGYVYDQNGRLVKR